MQLRHCFYLLVAAQFVASTSIANDDLHSRYMKCALQGQLSPLLAELQDPGADLTDEEQVLATKIQSRFGANRKLEVPDTEWPLVNDILLTYREYWVQVLLGDFTVEELEELIIARVGSVLDKYEIDRPDSLGVLDAVSVEFEKLGIQALTGRTLPHFDLLAWSANEAQDYRVELTDGPVDVHVYFMSDFVSYGWSHFATFGVAYPGGWAGDDALYCMNDDYDRASDKFKISYLKHEARHYADYEIFPELKSTDLEYRAKLTEVVYATETRMDILHTFVSHATRNAHAPHSLANHELISQLSRAIFDEDFVTDMERWRAVNQGDLQSTAASLLERHTQDLMAAGADSVTGVIVP